LNNVLTPILMGALLSASSRPPRIALTIQLPPKMAPRYRRHTFAGGGDAMRPQLTKVIKSGNILEHAAEIDRRPRPHGE
jgi:hypothetical protein